MLLLLWNVKELRKVKKCKIWFSQIWLWNVCAGTMITMCIHIIFIKHCCTFIIYFLKRNTWLKKDCRDQREKCKFSKSTARDELFMDWITELQKCMKSEGDLGGALVSLSLSLFLHASLNVSCWSKLTFAKFPHFYNQMFRISTEIFYICGVQTSFICVSENVFFCFHFKCFA